MAQHKDWECDREGEGAPIQNEVHAFLASVFGEPIPESPEPALPTVTPEKFCQTLAQVLANYRVQALSTWKGQEYFSLALLGRAPGDPHYLSLRTPNTTYELPIELPQCRPAEHS